MMDTKTPTKDIDIVISYINSALPYYLKSETHGSRLILSIFHRYKSPWEWQAVHVWLEPDGIKFTRGWRQDIDPPMIEHMVFWGDLADPECRTKIEKWLKTL